MTASGRNPRLADLSRACDPVAPADEATFTLLNKARGNSSQFADLAMQELQEFQEPTNSEDAARKKKWLLSGHVGCGKSSELRAVARAISAPSLDGKRFLPVLVDVLPTLDSFFVTPEAVQLVIVSELAQAFRDLPGGGIRLDTRYFVNLFREIFEIMRTPAESAEIEAGIAGFKAKFRYAFKLPSIRDKIQAMLRPQSADLLTELNNLLADTRKKLREYSIGREDVLPYDDFLIIVDSLDRMQQVPGVEIGLESQRRLFLTDSAQLTELDAYAIYAVPLTLARRYATNLFSKYGSHAFVLSMIKVCARGENEVYQAGQEVLHNLLSRRLGGEDPLTLIELEAFLYIVANTGGYLREFVAAIGDAARLTRGQKISMTEAETVIADNYANYENGIHKGWLEEMAELYRDPLRSVDLEDVKILEMLEAHYILEYQNGLDESDRKRRNSIWYGLHPLVRDSERLEQYLKTHPEPDLDEPSDEGFGEADGAL